MQALDGLDERFASELKKLDNRYQHQLNDEIEYQKELQARLEEQSVYVSETEQRQGEEMDRLKSQTKKLRKEMEEQRKKAR